MPTTLSRSLLTILVPGTVALAPWLLTLVQYTDVTFGMGQHPTLAHALLFAMVTVVGSLLNGLGSYLEAKWDDEREAEHGVKENWYAYLSAEFDHEPVGYRYISNLVTTLYFEVTMMLAVPIFFAGTAVLAIRRFPGYGLFMILSSTGLMVASVFYFRWQARDTHCVLCKARKEINDRVVRNRT